MIPLSYDVDRGASNGIVRLQISSFTCSLAKSLAANWGGPNQLKISTGTFIGFKAAAAHRKTLQGAVAPTIFLTARDIILSHDDSHEDYCMLVTRRPKSASMGRKADEKGAEEVCHLLSATDVSLSCCFG